MNNNSGKEEKRSNQTMIQSVSQTVDVGRFSDMLINNLIMSKLGSVMEAGFEMSASNITKLLILMSTGELKNFAVSILGVITNLLKKSPAYGLNLILKISNYLKKSKQELPKILEEVKEDKSYNKINIDTDLNFMIAFYNYFTNNHNCTYKSEPIGIEVRNVKEKISTERFKDITIKMPGYKIIIDNAINYGFNIETKEILSVQITDNFKYNTNVKNYIDLLTPDQQKIINQLYVYLHKNYGPTSDDVISYIYKISPFKTEKYFSEHDILNFICEKYPQFNKQQSFIELELVVCILYHYLGIAAISQAEDTLVKYNKMLLDIQNTYDVKQIKSSTNSHANEICNSYLSKWIEELKIDKKYIKQTFVNFLTIKDNIRQKKTDSCVNFCLSTIFLLDDDCELKINEIMAKFVTKINASYKKPSPKIKIYSLILDEVITSNELPNPEYSDWEAKKVLIEKIPNYNTDLTSFITLPIPPKTIKKDNIEKRIICKKLNEIEKDMDTLYLRECDKKKIMISLDQFKNQKQMMKDMGFQNKLNLLLYGLPGTGKSTAIQAVATYLQRDIYYMDLQKALLNEDLQIMIDYVNNNVQNGGIIVIEDIDAMTDVVLKRKPNKLNDTAVNNIISSQKNTLSLEYFLNILQGTLTIDNSIFIVTTNHIEQLDDAFYRDGRFDVKIELKLADHYQINSIFKKMISRDIPLELLEKIPENKFSPATIIYHIKEYIFKADATNEEILGKFISD